MSRLLAPPYILIHPADSMGCGHHRMMRPLEIMSKAGYCSGRADVNVWGDERLAALNPDVVVWQRQHDRAQVEAMRNSRKFVPKAFFVYEIDDIMSALPDWSPHRPYIPPDIDQEMAAAISVCDAVTTSTADLAQHIRSVCNFDIEVRVAPNMLAKEELDRVAEIRMLKPPPTEKLRIGWGGGHSHKGDLDIIIPAMRELQGKVEFVFVGQKPDCEVPCEFYPGVTPPEFLSFLAGLRLNLILAPLVDCKFNQCKSNLRLLEASAIGCPVIASPVTPYKTNSPPVVYAEDAADWTDKLVEYVRNPSCMGDRGDQMNAWLKRNYVMDDKLDQRLAYWTPRGTKAFVPKNKPPASSAVIYCPAGQPNQNTKYKVFNKFSEAVNAGGDIIYVRSGTTLTDDHVPRMLRHLNQSNTCSVSPMSNDGGCGGFPRVGQFTPIDVKKYAEIDELCRKLFPAVRVEVTNPAGPAMALSRRAMDAVGIPDLGEDEKIDPEEAFLEWGLLAAARGYMNIVVGNIFVTTTTQHNFAALDKLMFKCQMRYPIKQLQPDPLVEVRAELDLAYHAETYKAPLPSANVTYAEWAGLFNTLGPQDVSWMAENFPPLKIEQVAYPCERKNLLALKNKGVQWVMFHYHDVMVAEHALYTFAEAIYNDDSPNLVYYADHDFVANDGTCDRHDMKPARLDWHQLLQRDYITPICAIRVPDLLAVLHKDDEEIDDVILYGAVLDLVAEKGAHHVPRVLAHWPQSAVSVPAVLSTNLAKTMQADKRVKERGMRVTVNQRFPFLGYVSYAPLALEKNPLVSIIMPTGGKVEILTPGINSLLGMTTYKNFEVLVVVDPKADKISVEFLDDLAAKDPRVKLFKGKSKYNWSEINNIHVRKASGDLLLFLNDDTRIVEQCTGWLTEMVGAAMQDGVGAVGARLLYPYGTVQHVGVVCRAGMSGHLHKGISDSHPGYNGIAVLSHEATAVTGACMMVTRDVFNAVGGFDEKLVHNFNDVKFCLEANRLGYRNLVAAGADLHHLEGVTRMNVMSPEGTATLQSEAVYLNKHHPEKDPYWNDNLFFGHSQGGLMVTGLNCDLMSWPPEPWAHRETWQQETVLLVGDDGTGWTEESRKGSAPYFALMQGYSMQISRPVLANIQPFDIRESRVPFDVLAKLGITKIVVRSMLGGLVETLPFLLNLGIPVEYRPITPEAACPRTDFQTPGPDGQMTKCDGGWKRGKCQSCVLMSGSPFGAVSIVGWRDTWRRFFANANTTFTHVADIATRNAIEEIYPEAFAPQSEAAQ